MGDNSVPIIFISQYALPSSSSPADDDCLITCCCSPCVIIVLPFVFIYKAFKDRQKKKEKPLTILKPPSKDSQPSLIDTPDTSNDEEERQKHLEWIKIEKRKQREEILKCKESLGYELWELLERGSHNEKVVQGLKQQPQWVLDIIFENPDLRLKCGKSRMEFLKSQIGYIPSCKVINS